MTSQEQKAFEGTVERLLTYLTCSDEGWMEGVSTVENIFDHLSPQQVKFMRVPLTHFNGADPFPAFREFQGMTETYQRMFLDPSTIGPNDFSSADWDCCILKLSEERDPTEEEIAESRAVFLGKTGIYHLDRVRRVPLSEVRSRFPLKSGIVVEHSIGDIYKNGTFQTCREYCELRGGKWWVVGQPHEIQPVLAESSNQNVIEWSKSISFTSFYDWRVELAARKDLPSISFVTDPIGSREVFRLRDIPPGASRRAALRHWVGGHWRRKRDDEHEAMKIWPYLRGAEEFHWNGLHVRIVPSKHDTQKATQYGLMAQKNMPKSRRKA